MDEQQPVVDAYDRGRELGFQALLERRNPTPEWFHKAGVYHSYRSYATKRARTAFMGGWLSNWQQKEVQPAK